MSHNPCPDWSSLNAAPDAEHQADAWAEALAHLETCDRCRDEAFAVEPTVLFQDLPSLEVGHSEIDEMKRAVAAMRRAQPFEERANERSLVRLALRAAAFAGVGLGMLLLQGSLGREVPVAVETAAVTVLAETTLAETTLAEAPAEAPAIALPRLDAEPRPLVEEVEPLRGTMIQLVDADLDMVVFYSDNLDV